MSVSVGAVLKRVLMVVLGNPNSRKKLLTAVAVIISLILFPVIAIISILQSGYKFDSRSARQQIVANMSDTEKAKLKIVESMMKTIETNMKTAQFESRTKEAQVLYVLALSDISKSYTADSFSKKLASCFAKNQTDEQLVAKVNQTFKTAIKKTDFTNVMKNIRMQNIDTSGYTDKNTKNNLDLVKWVANAQKTGWGYVWGSYGELLDEKEYNRLESVFGFNVSQYKDFIKQNWFGKRTADCIGLIKGYGWYNVNTGKMQVGTNGMKDVTADGMYAAATEKGTINTMPEKLGLAVYMKGHIGVYIGNGKVIHAKGTKYGVVVSDLKNSGFTHWCKIPNIIYK